VHRPPRFTSVDQLVARTGLRRDELDTLADIGALQAFGYDRRSALWQAERAVRPSGELFEEGLEGLESQDGGRAHERRHERPTEVGRYEDADPHAHAHAYADADDVSSGAPVPEDCPLPPMTERERLVADYAGTGLTIGRHPMALRRDELIMRGIMRAIDLRTARQGRRVRVAGMVITRQRPGTAKGFVFLTLEDETGIANIIVRPDLFARDRLVLVEEPFLLVDGVLQHQDGVVSVRAESVQGLPSIPLDFEAHNFY
jgi:error-prone DNA polymerase